MRTAEVRCMLVLGAKAEAPAMAERVMAMESFMLTVGLV